MKPTTDAATQRRRSKSAARQAKRRRQWAEAVKAAGWTGVDELMTAVIRKRVQLPTKPKGE